MISANELKELTIGELVNYHKANKILVDYYNNEAAANVCYKNTKDKEYFDIPNEKFTKYSKVNKLIIKEIERRIDREDV